MPEYYVGKYDYFKKYGLVEDSVRESQLAELTEEYVRMELANISQVVFEVTDACNLKCKSCGYGELHDNYDVRVNKRLDYDSAVKLLESLNTFWNSSYSQSSDKEIHISFYGGEPLLNMKVVKDIISFTDSLNTKRRFVFSMTSNAIMLDKYMDYLVERNFEILVSLDGNRYNSMYRLDTMGNLLLV